MQNLPSMAGARGWPWRIEQVEPCGGGRGAQLMRLSRPAGAGADTLVAVRPHEPVAAIAADDRLAPMSAVQAAAAVSAAAQAERIAFALHAAERLCGEIHAWQLCAALALERGYPRVLVADEPGMGKTVSAAIAIAACLDAGHDRRCLVLVPGNLVPQWREELRRRLNIDATVIDAAALLRLQQEVPAGVLPWSLPGCLLASMDFLKQAHIAHGLETVTWDLAVIDEAHLACGASERRAGAGMIARRARRVLLLTATPSDGGDERLRTLLAMGSGPRDSPLICLRHAAAGHARVTRTLRVSPSRAERALQTALMRYLAWIATAPRQDAAVRLLGSVLIKRAVSSPHALRLSLTRRLARLENPRAVQPSLFDADGEPEAIGAVTGLPLDRERRRLDALIELAARAAADDRRLDALARLVRRAREPVVIFSCFRDTAALVASRLSAHARTAIIHGALPPAALHGALEAFTHGTVEVLAATDVASQGLNLQARCRWVVHYDLPWRPPTLQQRVGRVDRLGQTRRVHATLLELRGALPAAMRDRLALYEARMHEDERMTSRRWDTLAAVEAQRLRARRALAPTGDARLPGGDITAIEIELGAESGAASERRVFVLRACVARAVAWAEAWAARRRTRVARALACRASRRIARELDVRDAALEAIPASLQQDGLFERRAHRRREADRTTRAALAATARDAAARHSAESHITGVRVRTLATFGK